MPGNKQHRVAAVILHKKGDLPTPPTVRYKVGNRYLEPSTLNGCYKLKPGSSDGKEHVLTCQWYPMCETFYVCIDTYPLTQLSFTIRQLVSFLNRYKQKEVTVG